MFRKKEKNIKKSKIIKVNQDIVILNFALDTQTTANNAVKFGKLKKAKVYDLIDITEKMEEETDKIITSMLFSYLDSKIRNEIQHISNDEKTLYMKVLLNQLAKEWFVLSHLTKEDEVFYYEIDKTDEELRLAFINNKFIEFSLDKLTDMEKEQCSDLSFDETVVFLEKKCVLLYKSVHLGRYIGELNNKLLTHPDLELEKVLDKNELKHFNLFNEVKSAIYHANTVIILGHSCKDSDMIVSAERILYFFPNDMRNKHIDFVVYESSKFGVCFVNSLQEKMKNDPNFDCDGMTVSSRKYHTHSLLADTKINTKKTKNGLFIKPTVPIAAKNFFIEKPLNVDTPGEIFTLDRMIFISIEDGNEVAERYITTIFGLPFYCSSGLNSSVANTWFPFHGISDKVTEFDDMRIDIGWFIKCIEDENLFIPGNVQKDIKKACLSMSNDCSFASELIRRFATLPCLLISSVLGGGIWEHSGFKNLKQKLISKYQDFYSDFAEFEFSSSIINIDFREKNVNKIHFVNQWLINQSVDKNIKTVEDLKEKSLGTLEDLKPYKRTLNCSI